MTVATEPMVASSPTQIFARWTTSLLDLLPQIAGERYEIIDGDLYVTRRPHMRHQTVSVQFVIELGKWSKQTGLGRVISEPGLVYANDQAVAPDLVWIRYDRLETIFNENGHLHESPEIIIEILSASKADAERDREKKMALYSRQNVPEYWIVDWRMEMIEIYRHNQQQLSLVNTLSRTDQLTSQQLPGFSCVVSTFFEV